MMISKIKTNCKYGRLISQKFSHWSKLPLAPPDKILGLNQMFKADTNPNKVNLGVGAYRNNNGEPHVLESVEKAKVLVDEQYHDHEYTTIGGMKPFVDKAIEFAYGKDSDIIKSNRVAAVQTLSGTGACRLFAEFIARFRGRDTKVYLPNPTWSNHIAIMKNAGLDPHPYRYYNNTTQRVDYHGWLEDIMSAENGSVFLLHACAHNPTGCDPTPEQWNELSNMMKVKNHIVFFDCAYQGFASGNAEVDAYAIRKFVSDGHFLILAQSFAKNFGLYGERVGALSVVTSSPHEAECVLSQLLLLIRPMYSNPPINGARIVSTILHDDALTTQWKQDCLAMATRIKEMRLLLRTELEFLGSKHDWNHITDQIGMFCYSGLNLSQVQTLIQDYHIYLTDNGRISIAGINAHNVQYIAKAIHDVTKNT